MHLPRSKELLCFFGSLLFQEKAITPSESFLFPGTDWLIGNHSDELTPWIPVIAARRVISRHNLTQQLKCQLISPIGNNIMGRGRMCEYVCARVCQFIVCIFWGDHLMAMLSLSRLLFFSLMWLQMIISSLLFPVCWFQEHKRSFITNTFIVFCPHCRSSYSCRYFVLPCCFFDFYGKYQRRQCKKSQYKEYIDFITEVSQVSGFNTEEDCLRIPSTKRVGLPHSSCVWLPTVHFTLVLSVNICHIVWLASFTLLIYTPKQVTEHYSSCSRLLVLFIEMRTFSRPCDPVEL